MIKNHIIISVLLGLLLISSSFPAHAECLENALMSAYENAPQLVAERNQLKSLEERMAKGLASLSPDLATHKPAPPTQPFFPSQIRVLQPAAESPPPLSPEESEFLSSYSVIKTRINNSHTQIQELERNILMDAVTAFLNVAEARSIEETTRLHARTLEQLLTSADAAEKDSGDIAQIRTRYQSAKADLGHAENRLNTVLAAYQKTVGVPAEFCPLPAVLPAGIPATRSEVIAAAGNSDTADSAWQEFMAARFSRTLLMRTAEEARQTADATEAKYVKGASPLSQMMQAEQSLLDMRLNLIHAEKAMLLQAYRLLDATGKLTAQQIRQNAKPSFYNKASAWEDTGLTSQ